MSSMVEEMKEKMKVEGAAKEAEAASAKPSGAPNKPPPPTPPEGKEGDKGKEKVVARDPAESLKAMLAGDGVAAIRPADGAEEKMKAMERQVRTHESRSLLPPLPLPPFSYPSICLSLTRPLSIFPSRFFPFSHTLLSIHSSLSPSLIPSPSHPTNTHELPSISSTSKTTQP